MIPFEKALIVLPTYNEVDNIGKMLQQLNDVSDKINILVIEDGSPDGTAKVVKEFQKDHVNVHMIERSGKLGLGTAYITGFKWGLEKGFDYIFTMDSDFSHDPIEIPNFLKAAQENDLIIGSRYIDGIRIINWPLKRLLLSSFASFYVRMITGFPIKDPTGGFNCFTRKALQVMNLDQIFSVGYSFLVELKYKVWSRGLKVKEIPIIFYERRDGQSKMSGGVIFESVFAVFKLRMKKIFGTL